MRRRRTVSHDEIIYVIRFIDVSRWIQGKRRREENVHLAVPTEPGAGGFERTVPDGASRRQVVGAAPAVLNGGKAVLVDLGRDVERAAVSSECGGEP